ncbi:MAG TPA: hypothetical protein VIG82_12650 [Enteractinococcus sp.]
MSPHKYTNSPQKPEAAKSASRLGFFGILAEGALFVLVVIVGVRFLIMGSQPGIVAWILFAIGAVLVVDMIRRSIRAVRRSHSTQRLDE